MWKYLEQKILVRMHNDDDSMQMEGPFLQPKLHGHKCDQLQESKTNLSGLTRD